MHSLETVHVDDEKAASGVLIQGAKTLQAAVVAMGLYAAADSADAQGKTLKQLTTIPQECVTGTDPNNVCVKVLPQQMNELAQFLSDPAKVKRETPFYDRSVTPTDRCRFLKRLVDERGDRITALAAYMQQYHPDFVQEATAAFSKQPDDVQKLGESLGKASKFLGGCVLSPILVEPGLAMNEGKFDQATPLMGKAITRITKRMQEIHAEKAPKEKKKEALLPHATALTHALEILAAAASYR